MQELFSVTHRIAISNQRIVDIRNNRVQFHYKDYRDDRQKLMTLNGDEFIRRFLMHILPSGFMRIRHYGLLANRCRAKSIKLIRKILETVAPGKPKETNDVTITYPCPVCKKGLLMFKHKIIAEKTWAHPLPS